MKDKSKLNIFDKIIIVVVLVISPLLMIYSINGNSVNKTDQAVETVYNLIKKSSLDYLDYDDSILSTLYNDKYVTYITINDLVKANLVKKNQVTGINLNDLIEIKLNLSKGGIDVNYPIREKENIEFFSMNESITLGSTYNCLDEIGSYKMSFLDEHGNYIKLRNENNEIDPFIISKYSLRCEYDDKLDTFVEPVTISNEEINLSYDTVLPMKVGIYTVKYYYVNSLGQEKTFIKNLRVY